MPDANLLWALQTDGTAAKFPFMHQLWLVYPFMHSEKLQDQHVCPSYCHHLSIISTCQRAIKPMPPLPLHSLNSSLLFQFYLLAIVRALVSWWRISTDTASAACLPYSDDTPLSSCWHVTASLCWALASDDSGFLLRPAHQMLIADVRESDAADGGRV